MAQVAKGGVQQRRWGFAVVRGRSMEPTLADGDRLLVRHGVPVEVGDLVVARFPDGAVVVKRAAEARRTRTGAAGWWLLSDNPGVGVDSRHRGVVAAADVMAVVRCRVWPPGLRAARRRPDPM